MASSFRFKHFEVVNERSAMKVGTDGVLLGAWVSLSGDEAHILDVGTGTGVIALMMAQRSAKSVVVGIDIDAPSVEEAEANFKASPWADRMAAFKCDFRQMKPFPYELIVSNPPFFVNALKAPSARRSAARHNDTLSHAELVKAALDNLAPAGRMALVLPCDEAGAFLRIAEENGLYLCRLCRVRTTPHQEPKRFLMELCRTKKEPLEEELVIQCGNEYTAEYIKLTSDFYLKF